MGTWPFGYNEQSIRFSPTTGRGEGAGRTAEEQEGLRREILRSLLSMYAKAR